MPELPEVETVVRTLRPLVVGRRIVAVRDVDPLLCDPDDPGDVVKALAGAVICGLERRGKYVVMELDGRPAVAFHLRMTGRMVVCERVAGDRCRLELELDDGRKLLFCDVRRLGKVHLSRPVLLDEMGPDPLDRGFAEYFCERLQGRRTPIKAVLMDQRVAAGVGNIYADEALWRAGIDPRRPADSLTEGERVRLCEELGEVLRDSISSGGTSFRDYVNGQGVPGEFSKRLDVYQKTGESCVRCGGKIERVKVGGRGTHYCPGCQR